MHSITRFLNRSLIPAFLALGLLAPAAAQAGTAAEIARDAKSALQKLYDREPAAKALGKSAKAILVFPKVVKAGLIVGGEYGEGALLKDGKAVAYYNTAAGSYGLQAGAQSFGYALFFMNDKALAHLESSKGWEIGVGPNVVVVDAGMAKKLTTTTGQDDIYAFVFGQEGLMAGIGLQGGKITKLDK